MPIITISRGSMSGGTALAECLSQNLGVPCVGREEVAEKAGALIGVSPTVVEEKLMQSPSFWDRVTADRRRYVVALQAVLADHALSGNFVYHGQAGHLLLRGLPAVLRVRLIAPLEVRVRSLMERHGMRRQAALDYIKQVDEDRLRWTRMVYDADLRDPGLYDLVINLETLSLQSACAVVTEAARRPEFAVTPEVHSALADFALASRVKLALATHVATRGSVFEVTAKGGAVTVTGVVPEPAMLTHVSSRLAEEVEGVVRTVAGVTGVTLDLQQFDAYH